MGDRTDRIAVNEMITLLAFFYSYLIVGGNLLLFS